MPLVSPRYGLLGDYSRAAAVRHADFWLTDGAAGILISVAVEDLLVQQAKLAAEFSPASSDCVQPFQPELVTDHLPHFLIQPK